MGRSSSLSRSRRVAMTERLLEWHDEALAAGRQDRAARLLLLAWRAYDEPQISTAESAEPPSGASRPSVPVPE